MKDQITLTLSLGELFTLRAAVERWQTKLEDYEKSELSEGQQADVRKFKSETRSILKAIANARAEFLRGGAHA